MFQCFRKYRHLFVIATMGFYLVGGLQFSMLECLHFFSHLDDLSTGKFDSHSFHSHNDSHQHNALAVLGDLIENNPSDEVPINENSDTSFKKSPQLIAVSDADQIDCRKLISVIFKKLEPWDSYSSSIPSPPPQV